MDGARLDGNSLLEMYQNSAGETGAGRTNKSCPSRRRESRDGEAPIRDVTLCGSNLPGKQIVVGNVHGQC